MNKTFPNSTFSENFYQCCCNSCFALVNQQREDSAEYKQAVEKSAELIEKMRVQLADPDLIFEYEESENHRHGISYDCVYQQGFQACIYLLRWMGAL